MKPIDRGNGASLGSSFTHAADPRQGIAMDNQSSDETANQPGDFHASRALWSSGKESNTIWLGGTVVATFKVISGSHLVKSYELPFHQHADEAGIPPRNRWRGRFAGEERRDVNNRKLSI